MSQNGPICDRDHARLLAKSKSGGKTRMVGSTDMHLYKTLNQNESQHHQAVL
ncbi:hypothetical protein P9F85_11230 [Bacillus stercoris]|uniref:hypothetical protein n=1 Tax=Bacillus stercoris TaxID=2054641 RepID=UPI002DB9F17E|nr:hypothetical protein [Bacillus stercoris]MEC2111818.1 hypothetical protein [Bacillus stercoris]